MKHRHVALLVCVVLLCALGLWVWSSLGAVGTGALPSDPIVAATQDGTPLEAKATDELATGRVQLTEVSAVNDASSTEASATTGSLVVHVAWSDGGPAAKVTVHARRPGAGTPWRFLGQRVTDVAGVARLENLPAVEVEIGVDRGVRQKIEIVAGQEQEVRLEIPAGVAVEGTVRDDAGAPVAGAGIWLTTHYGTWAGGRIVSHADSGGSFRLRDVPGEQSLGALASGFAPSALVDLEERDTSKSPVRVELVLAAPGGSLAGRVLDDSGEGLAGARVAIGTPGFHVRYRTAGRMQEGWSARTVETDAGGRYAIASLAPGTHRVEVSAPGHPFWHGECEVVVGRESWLEIHLENGVTVHGVVHDADRVPLPGAVVRAFPVAIAEMYLPMGQYDCDSIFGYRHATADAAGRYEIEQIALGSIHLYAGRGGSMSRGEGARPWADTVLQGIAGATLEWNPVIEPGATIEGEVLYRDGAPMPDVFVIALQGGKDKRQLEGRSVIETDEQGRFRFVRLEHRPYDVHVQLLGAPKDQPLLERSGVWPGQEPLRFVAGYDAPRKQDPGIVRGRVLDAGARLRGAALGVVLIAETGWRFGGKVEGDAFRCERLPPDRYRLKLLSGEDTIHVGPWFELRAGEDRDLGTVITEAGGAVLVHIDREEGAEEAEAMSITLIHEDGARRFASPGLAAQCRIENVSAGEHRVLVEARDAVAAESSCMVVAGREASATLALRRGSLRQAVVEYPVGQRLQSIRVTDAEGGVFSDSSFAIPLSNPCRTEIRLPVGRYVLYAETVSDAVGEVSFAVESLDEAQEPVVLKLR